MSEASDTTPLLTSADGLSRPDRTQDHPIFLRICHSPWKFIPQNILVILRGVLLVYLVTGAFMVAGYKLRSESDYTQWRHVFDFALISWSLTLLYHLVTFCWTFTHMYYPDPEDSEGGLEGYLISAMSLPRNMASLRKQFYFSMFYTTTCVFAFMNSAIYWFITRQPSRVDTPELVYHTLDVGESRGFLLHDKPFSDLFGEGWYKAFTLINLYAVNSIIMMIEILLLNSMKRPYAVGFHAIGLLFSACLYLGWAGIGQFLTGWYAFGWMDKKQVGSSEAVAAYCIGFVLSADIMYIFQHGFINIREGFVRSVYGGPPEATADEPLES